MRPGAAASGGQQELSHIEIVAKRREGAMPLPVSEASVLVDAVALESVVDELVVVESVELLTLLS